MQPRQQKRVSRALFSSNRPKSPRRVRVRRMSPISLAAKRRRRRRKWLPPGSGLDAEQRVKQLETLGHYHGSYYMCESCSRCKTMLILACRCCQVHPVWQRGRIECLWEEVRSQTEGCCQWRWQFHPRGCGQQRWLSSTIFQSSRACVSMTDVIQSSVPAFSFVQFQFLCRKKVTKSKSTVKSTASKSSCKSWSCDDPNQS